MPSILIEAGFMTNLKEGEYLNSKKGQVEISSSIFKAIESYKRAINFSGNLTVEPQVQNPIMYKVQISASKRRLELKSYNFKGLTDLSRVKQGSLYKYFYSSSYDLEEIQKKRKLARSRGFPNAYIVGFDNGKLFDVDK